MVVPRAPRRRSDDRVFEIGKRQLQSFQDHGAVHRRDAKNPQDVSHQPGPENPNGGTIDSGTGFPDKPFDVSGGNKVTGGGAAYGR